MTLQKNGEKLAKKLVDHYSEDTSFEEDELSDSQKSGKVKEKEAQQYFQQINETKEGQKQIKKNLLSSNLGYAQYFANGFSLKQFDKNMSHLTNQEKSILIGHLISALDLNLKECSRKDSPEDKRRENEISKQKRKRQKLRMETNTLPTKEEIEAKKIARQKELMEIIRAKQYDSDYDSEDSYYKEMPSNTPKMTTEQKALLKQARTLLDKLHPP